MWQEAANETAEGIPPPSFPTPIKALLSTLPCLLFLGINVLMLLTLLRKPLLLESSRYVLFAHLLLMDSVQLLLALLLYVFAAAAVRMVSYACMTAVLLASMMVKISPLNLAVMSLERYVAICFPLRHGHVVTMRSTGAAVAAVWTMASVDTFTQVGLFVGLENTGFTLSTFCTRHTVFQLSIYSVIHEAFTVAYFALISVIILCTYVAVALAVRSVARGRNARKARETVLLHLVQLCLCLTSTLFDMIRSKAEWRRRPTPGLSLQYVLFVSLIILPKCLSPLIYGLRDQTLRRVFKSQLALSFGATGRTDGRTPTRR